MDSYFKTVKESTMKYYVCAIIHAGEKLTNDDVVKCLSDKYSISKGVGKKPFIGLNCHTTQSTPQEPTDGVFDGAERRSNGSTLVGFINLTKKTTAKSFWDNLNQHRWDVTTTDDGEELVRLLLPVE